MALTPKGHVSTGRLHARAVLPSIPSELDAGTYTLTFPVKREAQFHIPASYDAHMPAPLLLLFHGAQGQDGGVVATALAWAERHGALLIAQKSMGPSWDIVGGGFGPDLALTDCLLGWTMQRYAVNPSRIGIAGFSDGASYALSVGLANGDLFHDILAFSPGFARPPGRIGHPRIFIAHGKDDPILKVDYGRGIARQLALDGYDVQYCEFDGGHLVPPLVAEAAMDRFVR